MRHLPPLLHRVCAVVLAVGWVIGGIGAALHDREAQHAVCAEHGVVEDLAAAEHLSDTATVEAAPAADDDHHDACGHGVAVTETFAALVPPRPTRVERVPPLVPPVLGPATAADQGPRGPPLLQLAAKTSPPRA